MFGEDEFLGLTQLTFLVNVDTLTYQYRVIQRTLESKWKEEKSTSESINIRYASTHRQDCFLSVTKIIVRFHCSINSPGQIGFDLEKNNTKLNFS